MTMTTFPTPRPQDGTSFKGQATTQPPIASKSIPKEVVTKIIEYSVRERAANMIDAPRVRNTTCEHNSFAFPMVPFANWTYRPVSSRRQAPQRG